VKTIKTAAVQSGILAVLLMLLVSCSYNTTLKSKQPDTLFIDRPRFNAPNISYHAFFIDTTGNPDLYMDIADFSFGSFDTAEFESSLNYLQRQKLNLSRKEINGLPRNWVKVQMYKGRIYAYVPSDFCSHYKFRITDTACIDFTVEGPCASSINQYRKQDNNTFRFDLSGQYRKKRELIIHIIDAEKGIAVFEDINHDPEWKRHDYFLMANADHLRKLPVIVNFMDSSRQEELEFDTLDLRSLLK
jgi:hypothetical protein